MSQKKRSKVWRPRQPFFIRKYMLEHLNTCWIGEDANQLQNHRNTRWIGGDANQLQNHQIIKF